MAEHSASGFVSGHGPFFNHINAKQCKSQVMPRLTNAQTPSHPVTLSEEHQLGMQL